MVRVLVDVRLDGPRSGQLLARRCLPDVCCTLLPDVVLKLRDAHPGVRLSVHSSSITPLRDLLDARQLDMALTWDYPCNRSADERLISNETLTDATVLIVPRGHALARESKIDLAEMKNDDWIVRAGGHPTTEHLFRCADTSGFHPRVAIEASDYQETQAMIAAGLGVTLCPQLATSYIRDDVVVKRLEASVPARRIGIARPADVKPSVAKHTPRSSRSRRGRSTQRRIELMGPSNRPRSVRSACCELARPARWR